MARPAVGSVLRRATRRGTSFYLRVTWSDPATGETTRLLVPLGGEWEGWDEARVHQERELIATLIARGEWVPPQQRPSITPPTRDASANAETFQVAASRHFDRRKRRMGSDKSRKDLRWRLAHAVKYLGDKPVDEISAGDIDDMVDTMLRERDTITEAAAQGAALVEDYLDERTGRAHQRRRRGLSNSSINKIVRAVRQVLADSVRHRVIDRNVADDPHTLVRENGPQRSFLEPFQIAALLDASAALEQARRGLSWDDVHAIAPAAIPTSRSRVATTSRTY